MAVIRGNTIGGGKIGIDIPADADILVEGNFLDENEVGILVRSPVARQAATEYLAAERSGLPRNEIERDHLPKLRKAGFPIDLWLSRGANVAQILTSILAG